jgi:nucleoporin GLE1
LFLYLINCLAKDMIKQFDGECGPVPSKADPIGVVAAQVFSTKDFMWRGKPLIDIMMAKFRVACPVLFGYRGSEKTEQGRARLGWRKIEGHWMHEQQHFDRMKGLGVGYASIALRDFSKAKNTNPYPPANYWTSLAKIVNTPPAEISDTQCVVLRAMIYLYEEKFINFYGNQAIAALRKALIEFPAKAPNKTASVSSLQVLAQLYLKDSGLDLR